MRQPVLLDYAMIEIDSKQALAQAKQEGANPGLKLRPFEKGTVINCLTVDGLCLSDRLESEEGCLWIEAVQVNGSLEIHLPEGDLSEISLRSSTIMGDLILSTRNRPADTTVYEIPHTVDLRGLHVEGCCDFSLLVAESIVCDPEQAEALSRLCPQIPLCYPGLRRKKGQ